MDDRRCLIVDKQHVVRAGVRRLLGDDFDVEEASGLREALEAVTATGSFDVIVVELDHERHADGGPAGSSVIRSLRKAMPSAGIVAFANRPEKHAAAHALDAGASAFVAKTSPTETIRRAIDCAIEFTEFVDPAARRNDAPLTRRQGQILQLLADGVSTADVADRLGLSAETVRTHTKGTLARLEARDRAHAVAIGLRSGLID